MPALPNAKYTSKTKGRNVSDILLQATGLSVSHHSRPAIENVSLILNKGEITTLIGPNGAGKSTLVKTLLGLQKTHSGSIIKKNQLLIGYMPQKINIDPTFPLTVKRFWQLGQGKNSINNQQYQDLLNRCRVTHLQNQPMQSLSGGEVQRVMLMRALMNNPELLILDEPVQGVDISGQIQMYQLIDELRGSLGCGILMVSHDLHLVAAATDQVICLNNHVCCSGSPAQVSQDPAIIELFGKAGANALALYSHTHDHHHDSRGAIVQGQHSERCQHD